MTIRTQRSQRLDLRRVWHARRDSNPNLLIRRSVQGVQPVLRNPYQQVRVHRTSGDDSWVRCWRRERVANAEAGMNTVERRVRAMINPWSTALTRWWCHSAARLALTGHGAPRGRGRDVPRPTPADAPADGMPQAVWIEALTQADVASAVALAVRVLRVKPGDRGQQFASDVTDELRQMSVAKADGQVVGYGRVIELASDQAGPGTPAGCYLSGVLVDPSWRGRGIAAALTRARLRWAFARTDSVLCRRSGQCRLASSSRGSRISGTQALRERQVRSWRGRAVAAGEEQAPYGPGRLEAQPHWQLGAGPSRVESWLRPRQQCWQHYRPRVRPVAAGDWSMARPSGVHRVSVCESRQGCFSAVR